MLSDLGYWDIFTHLNFFRYLTIANEGDIRPFIRFIAECTERTLDAYLWATHEYELKPVEMLDRDEAELPSNIVEHGLGIKYHDLHDFRGPDEMLEQGQQGRAEEQGQQGRAEYSETIILPPPDNRSGNVLTND